MDAVNEFMNMGGYGGYVWPAYGLTAIVMGGILGQTLKSLRDRRRELKAYEAVAGARRSRRNREDDTDGSET